MKELLKIDLRIARNQSGLSGQDVSTLLETSAARLSKLENGYARPKVREIICLSLIYGRSIDELFTLSSSPLTDKLSHNLSKIDFSGNPENQSHKVRLDTLNSLVTRLQTLNEKHHA